MDKQQEIEKMAYCLCTLPEKYGLPLSCESCGNNGNCVRQKTAEELIKKGYGDLRAAVKEFSERFKARFFFIMATNMKSPIYQCTGDEIDRLVKEVCGDE